MVYTIIENPPPGRRDSNSITTTQSFNDDEETLARLRNNNTTSSTILESNSRTQPYTIIRDEPSAPIIVEKPSPTLIQPINLSVNNIVNIAGSNAVLSARYENTGVINSINSRTLFTNNGAGSRTQDDNTPAIWDTTTNKVNVQSDNEVIEIQVRFTATTDTLGGAFELELESIQNSFVIDKQEFNINIQEQDYTATFKVITTTDDATAGISIYISPELGMTLNLTDIEFIFTKSLTI